MVIVSRANFLTILTFGRCKYYPIFHLPFPNSTLLRTLPKRSDLQELCLKFAQAYRCGPDASLPVEEASDQEQQATHTPTVSLSLLAPHSGWVGTPFLT